jgi:hypothetical protein
MNPQATAQVRRSGSDGEIRIPPVLPRLGLRQSFSLHDRRRRLESLTALAVSHTLNPGPVPTFMLRHTAGSLVAVPATLTDRSSGPHMDKVPESVIDAPRDIGLRAAAQLWR